MRATVNVAIKYKRSITLLWLQCSKVKYNLDTMANPEQSHIELRISGPESEISVPFLQGMVNRMVVSYFKFGKVIDAYPEKVDAQASLLQRLAKYNETGNTEFLIDVANFAMIEFMRPSRPDASFEPTDSGESPGRTTQAGEVTDAPNLEL